MHVSRQRQVQGRLLRQPGSRDHGRRKSEEKETVRGQPLHRALLPVQLEREHAAVHVEADGRGSSAGLHDLGHVRQGHQELAARNAPLLRLRR